MLWLCPKVWKVWRVILVRGIIAANFQLVLEYFVGPVSPKDIAERIIYAIPENTIISGTSAAVSQISF